MGSQSWTQLSTAHHIHILYVCVCRRFIYAYYRYINSIIYIPICMCAHTQTYVQNEPQVPVLQEGGPHPGPKSGLLT